MNLYTKDIEGFLSNPFFVALKIKDTDSNAIKNNLKTAIEMEGHQNDYPYQCILDNYFLRHKEQKQNEYRFRKDYLSIVKEVVLEYLLEEDCLKYFLVDEEELTKIINLLKRKQYNAKLLTIILNRIAFFMNFSSSAMENDLHLILERDIKRKIAEFNNNYVMQKMGALKTIVDKVASGVKTECYLEFEKGYSEFYSPELKAYIMEKHGYIYDKHRFSSSEFLYMQESDDKALSLAIINDESFWNFNIINCKTLLPFIHLVVKYNSLKHAEKLIDYAFEQVCKDPICKYLYEHNMPLYISLSPEKRMIDWCKSRLEIQLSAVTRGKQVEESDYNGFLYPLYNGYEDCVLKGKEIFVNFVKKAYEFNSEEIFKIFGNLESIIQDKVDRKRLLTLQMLLECYIFGYDENPQLQKFMYGYYSNFGSKESILGRMYYRCYIIDKLTGSISNECLYEIFFEIFSMIERKYNIKCSYTINHSLREENYNALKIILKNYGFELTDEHKKNYVIALLDRKYASFEEVEMFPQLEQLGDAIYELAVANIFFYNPETELNHQNRESLVNANAQIKISKNIGLDKLYISNLHNALNSKFLHNEKIDMGLVLNYDKNYLADSLEMIIGAISKEFGVQTALDFSTKIILEAHSKLKKPQFEPFDIIELNNKIEKYHTENLSWEYRDYIDKIFPGLSIQDRQYFSEYDMLYHALNKVLMIQIIGNDTKDKRKHISSDWYNLDMTGKNFQYVYSYLYYGIEKTIEKFADELKRREENK